MNNTMGAQAFVLARLGEIGNCSLGNAEKGIPSSLASATPEQLTAYVSQLNRAIVPLTDLLHLTCIDGRFRICNCDQSLPETRLGHIGGTLTLPAIASTAGLDIVDQLLAKGRWDEAMAVLEKLLGLKRSGHKGGCGGAKGLALHQQTIHDNSDVMTATEAVMGHKELEHLTGVSYDSIIAHSVRKRAGHTAEQLRADNWSGDEQVQTAISVCPAGVEELKTDADKPHNGHDEPAVLVVFSIGGENTLSGDELEKLGLGRPFIYSLNFTFSTARKLAGVENGPDVQAYVISDIADHVAGASDLASPETPIILVIIP